MSTIAPPIRDPSPQPPQQPLPPVAAFAPARAEDRSPTAWAMALRSGRVVIGGSILLGILVACVATLPWTLHTPKGESAVYEQQENRTVRHKPERQPVKGWFGYDGVGRSLLARCLLGRSEEHTS